MAAKSIDRSTLNAVDFIFAGAIHIIVVLLIVTLSWWHSISEPKPLKRIEVEMISAKELSQMKKPRPVVKQKRKIVKPKAKKPAKVIEDDFDPFAPVESQSDVATPEKATRNDMAQVMGKQLSRQEVDRYIAMMQQAVQSHWKVPAGVDSDLSDPLVEMILTRNGSVASVRIIESSGNKSLDQTLLAAIHAAAPFQIPKQQFEVFRINQVRFRPLKQ